MKDNFHLLEKARKIKSRLSADEESQLIENLNSTTIIYGVEFVKGKWDELENKILKRSKKSWKDEYNNKLDKYIQKYSTEILGKRWIEAEKMLLEFKPSMYHVKYAKKLIGKWEELEKSIIENIVLVYKHGDESPDACSVGVEYASNVLKCRWPELEKKLLKQENSYHSINYLNYLIKDRWPELENRLIKSTNRYTAAKLSLDYLKITKLRIIELETIINEDHHTKYVYKDCIKREIEKLLKKKNYDEILKYCDYEHYSSIIKNFYKKYFIPDILKNSILAQSLVGHKESLKALHEDKVFKNKVKSLIEELIKNNTISEDSSAKEILRVIG